LASRCDWREWLPAAFVVLGAWGLAGAALQPSEIFVVYNRNNPQSRELAQYYAAKRGVPANQSIGLDVPDREEITREGYVAKIRDPLRAWFGREDLRDRIKCIVLMYGVPLRVGRAGALPNERLLVQQTGEDLVAAAKQLDGIAAELARLTGEAFAGSQPATRPDGKPDAGTIVSRYQALRDKAVEQQRTIKDPAAAQAAGAGLKALLERSEGVLPLISMLQGGDAAGKQAIAQMKAQAEQRREQLRSMLRGCPRGAERAEAHKMLQRLYGLRGLVEHLQQDWNELDGAETQASVDSELSLLWWDDYPLYRWVFNPMCLRVQHDPIFRGAAVRDAANQPVVMVARLDAPKAEIVRRMIDDAMASEGRGPSGKVYIDARGLSGDKDGYGKYDADLRELAKLVQARTPLPVVIDNRAELFAEGACPDAGLYCGWYSLGKYISAFKWTRGSVAYHIASSEAVSLRSSPAQYWCKRMLEEGVAATLGPVAEPYLIAFPLPRDFFGLLLTGRYTLVECYYMTSNFNSWMMTLLGDPLYNPYKARPMMKTEDVLPAEWFNGTTTQAAVAGK